MDIKITIIREGIKNVWNEESSEYDMHKELFDIRTAGDY